VFAPPILVVVGELPIVAINVDTEFGLVLVCLLNMPAIAIFVADNGRRRTCSGESESADESARRLMVIGHNPGLSDFLFCSVQYDDKFPTAAVACLTVEIDAWSEFHPQQTVRLQEIWRPREVE
jgi:hypothetical protein